MRITSVWAFIMLIPTQMISQSTFQGGQASQIVEKAYLRLDSYAKIILKYNGPSIQTKSLKEDIIDCFATDCILEMDIYRLLGKRVKDTKEQQTLSFYLQKMEEISKSREVHFTVIGKPVVIEKSKAILATIEVTSNKNSYRCKAQAGFNENLQIRYIRFSEFEDIPNIPVTEPQKKPEIITPNLNFSVGYKLSNCFNLSIGLNGLSNNWFMNHLRFDVEFNYLFNQEHAHYPTSTGGTPSQLTYISETGDFGIGINIGYRIIPDKYGELHWGATHLSASIGFGGVFYDKWWEYLGSPEGESHERSAAPYIKPSICIEYLCSDHVGLGLELGYYICPNYEPMQGLGIKFVTKFAL